MPKDMNYLQALEKAVKEKYGVEATFNPKQFWDDEKEKEYIQSINEAQKKEYLNIKTQEKIYIDGILMPKNLLNKNNVNVCEMCKTYSFNKKDDLYLNKFKTCYKCYVCNIEDKQNG